MLVAIDGNVAGIPVSLKVDISLSQEVNQAFLQWIQQLPRDAAQSYPAMAAPAAQEAAVQPTLATQPVRRGPGRPAGQPKKTRRPMQRRITQTADGRTVVSGPEMTMLRRLPKDGSAVGLPDLAEAVWPGRTSPQGRPLVGPAARVASGLVDKGLATIEGVGGDKMVSALPDWKGRAVEEQK